MSRARLTQRRWLAVATLMLCTPLASWGLDSDRNQPIHIEADRATLNEQNETSTYEGNVQLRQGTLKLQGEKMMVYLVNKQVDRIILSGKPAGLQQRRDGEASDKHAEADSIEYSAINERVVLLGNARIWQDKNEEFRSERIVFNLKDNTVNAGGESKDGRVHITLQPKNPPDSSEEKGLQ